MLELADVSKYFGNLTAVDGVSLTVQPQQIAGLIGPNGAGKTTLFNVVTGFLPADAGDIRFQGESLVRMKPHEIAARGILRTFQTPVGFPRMTLLENLMTIPRRQHGEGLLAAIVSPPRVRLQEAELKEKALSVLETVGLVARRHDWVRDLTPGEMKMLEFARQLMGDPQVLLLDEPASGVNPAVLTRLVDYLQSLRSRGLTFLLVDHNLRFILEICDVIHVLAEGRLVCSGPPAEIARDPRVIDIYLGQAEDRHSA